MKFRLLFWSQPKAFSTRCNIESGVRVRFAPSPTGSIHLGGIKTALYNYIFAKQNNGTFVLRIEDTDQKRLVPDSASSIENVLNWANLKPDESPLVGGNYGPYHQSQRLNIYKERSEQLIEDGKAYRCFCTMERLELVRKNQSRNREKPRYDGKCKSLSPSEIKEKLASSDPRHVVRLALKPGLTSFNDLIFGTISNNLLDMKESDPVLLKSDFYPTYHFANVVDDHEMKISHVLRGSEWIASTTKHIQLYEAFGWSQPTFMHFPLISMTDGTKMSKRNDQSHVQSFIDAGYSPRALINFLTSIGGGISKTKQDRNEIWSLEEIVENFDFSRMTCHPGSADMARLAIYSSNDLVKGWHDDPDEMLRRFKSLLQSQSIKTDLSDCSLRCILDRFIDGRLVTLKDLLSGDNRYVWAVPRLTWAKETFSGELDVLISGIIDIVRNTSIDDKINLDRLLVELGSEHQMKKPTLFKLIRMILTNSEHGLPIYDIFECLGRERLISYLENGLAHIK